MKTLFAVSVFASLAAAGCATSGNGLPGRDGLSPGGVRPPGIPGNDQMPAGAGMPERISRAELPAVDRLSRKIVHEHHGVISAQVRLCVAPDGAVSGVEVVEPSGMAEYDAAVVETITGWQYASFDGDPEQRICQKLTVGYRTP